MMCFAATFMTFIGSLIGMRLAYGSWPWEARKTWHWTESEIQFLRDTKEDREVEPGVWR